VRFFYLRTVVTLSAEERSSFSRSKRARDGAPKCDRSSRFRSFVLKRTMQIIYAIVDTFFFARTSRVLFLRSRLFTFRERVVLKVLT